MKKTWLTLLALGFATVACVGDRGPANSTDAGPDATDARGEARSQMCPAHAGGNDLSLVLDCKSESCDVKASLDFHLDKSNHAYPGCGVGPKNLDLANVNHSDDPLAGNDKALLRLGVTGYRGKGSYALEPTTSKGGPFFELAATPSCLVTGGPAAVPLLLIAQVPPVNPDSGLDAAIVTPPSCTLVVDSDCTNGDATHNVTGKLSCSFPSPGAGWSCTLTGGKFEFDDCVP